MSQLRLCFRHHPPPPLLTELCPLACNFQHTCDSALNFVQTNAAEVNSLAASCLKTL